MFCSKCGTETPDDSQFCRKCGQGLAVSTSSGVGAGAAVAPARVPEPKPKPKLVRAPYAIAGILLIVTLFYASNASQNSGNHAVNPIDQLVKQRHIVTFKNPALPIKALNFAYFKIDVPSGATSVRLLGNFTASGGTGNDVVAFLFPENDFVNWQNRHATTNLYNSGMVTVGTIDVNLPSNVATYYLVFNNRFSLFAQKTVDVDVTLAYYQ